MQNQGASCDLARACSDRRQRGWPGTRRRRPGAHQTGPPETTLAFAEELHDLAALFLAGHHFDERDTMPGKDDAGHAMRDVAQRLAVPRARVEEGHGRVATPWYVLHVGDKGIVVGE